MTSYRAAWWLPDAHSATVWGRVGRFEPAFAPRLEKWDTPDGDFIEVAHFDAPQATASSPRLVILHGLEGGVHSHYVRAFAREAAARRWNATLMLFRTCGTEINRLPRSYHSGETGDPSFVIDRLASLYPQSLLGVVGVSLGGNVLAKLLGEQGAQVNPVVRSAVTISAPFDLARASRRIGQGFGVVYEKTFLRTLIPKALQKISRHRELASLASVKRSKTIWDFDDRFTSPLHGFNDAADYYARSSSLQFLSRIQRPTLLLNAVDDPFLPPAVLDGVRAATQHNSMISVEFPERGGHVGFTSGTNPFRPFYYAEWRALEFLSQFVEQQS